MRKCKNCGNELHKGMNLICDYCGAELNTELNNFDEFLKEVNNEKDEIIWESDEQRKWVIRQCRMFGFDPDHPDIQKKLISDYNEKFGVKKEPDLL